MPNASIVKQIISIDSQKYLIMSLLNLLKYDLIICKEMPARQQWIVVLHVQQNSYWQVATKMSKVRCIKVASVRFLIEDEEMALNHNFSHFKIQCLLWYCLQFQVRYSLSL